ncbi:hypothetical protein B4Q04_20095 [Zobellia sp. OII3]|uniref:hypothetical protein n=1 Tax=Zobellia sp. OII3 TaxID=2034520 RepID=UPI000B533D3C|nr:hypothetical protein [Zobellia sp. OII3]OWW23503.1 hypothetical protein B4Q04_20095 [Zobellia sp. OII3]
MRWDKKIRAGALQFVLFIGAIIAVLLIMFVLISHTQNLFNKKTALTVDLIQAADYAIDYSLANDFVVGKNIEIPYQEGSPISLEIRKDFWGIFEKITSTSKQNSIEFSKSALVGGNWSEMSALYLKDKQRPLIVAGKTKITGDAYLPQQGIRMGNISGNSYSHQQLLYGTKRNSQDELPKLKSSVLNQIIQLTNNSFGEVKEEIRLKRNLELRNSFQSPTIFIREGTVHLEMVALSGNIVISATDRIIVEPSAQLRDVLLIAPEILIKDSVQGYFQAFANKNIHVGKNCNLGYPTALVVRNPAQSNKKNSDQKPKLAIDAHSEIKGALIYLENIKDQSYVPSIKIGENVIVQGEIYCEKNLELKGSVYGNVTTDGFIAMENGSIYQNHIYNGIIDGSSLVPGYAGLLYETAPSKKVMKWLY